MPSKEARTALVNKHGCTSACCDQRMDCPVRGVVIPCEEPLPGAFCRASNTFVQTLRVPPLPCGLPSPVVSTPPNTAAARATPARCAHLQVRLRRILEQRIDLLGRRLLLHLEHNVCDGRVGQRHAHREAVQLACAVLVARVQLCGGSVDTEPEDELSRAL
eukprot:362928-Chlamydomonas_euryale.AAC.2